MTGLIRPGDVVIFYVAKSGSRTLGARVVAAYRVAGEWYVGEEPLWPDEREEGRVLYPYRVPLEPVVECRGVEAPAMRDLVPVLGFIVKKERWHAYLVGTPANAGRPLPPGDAESILRILAERCRSG